LDLKQELSALHDEKTRTYMLYETAARAYYGMDCRMNIVLNYYK
jgi:hypothetical protein